MSHPYLWKPKNTKVNIYIVYWNSFAVFNDYRQLQIPLPLTKQQMMDDVGQVCCTKENCESRLELLGGTKIFFEFFFPFRFLF